MAKKESQRVENLIEFIEWAAQFNDEQYLFRGVSNDAYEIEASAYRRLPKLGRNNPSKLLEINKRLIEYARSLGHDQKNGQQLSDLELLAELQHFGAATCLIDFSRSALVALWFACQQSSTGEEANGKVFAVRGDDPARFKTVNPELIKQDIDCFFRPDEHNKYRLYQWEPKLQNNRIIAQHSVFVFGTLQIEVEAECVIIKGGKRKIKNNKQKILESLDQLSDITEASMYPDFDGFARLHAHDKPYIESNVHNYLRRGNEAQKNNNLDDAIFYYNEVIRLAQAHPGIVAIAYNNCGIAYDDKGEVDRAIENYTKSIEFKPDFDHVYFNRGGAYKGENNYDHALKDFTKAINLNPNFAGAYNHRGVVYLDKGDYDLAIADFTKAIDLKPDFIAEVYYNRGLAYHKKDEIDKALKDYTKAIDLKPDFVSEVYYNRGRVWLHLRKWENAKSDLTTARDKQMNIVAAFHNDYGSVPDFEQRNRVKLPEDIAEMLTPQQ